MERRVPRLVLLFALLAGACAGFPDPEEISFSDPTGRVQKRKEEPLPRTFLTAIGGIRAAGGDGGIGPGLALGGEFSRVSESGTGFEAGLLYSEYGDVFDDEDVTAVELYGGGRLAYVTRLFSPYVGAGVSAMGATGGDSGGSIGAYAHAGLSVRTGSRTSFGLDIRGYVGTKNSQERYLQFAFTVGLSF